MALNIPNSTKFHMTPSQATNAIVTYEGLLTAVVEATLNQLVSSGKQENYANYNSDLILWNYEKNEWRKASIRDWMVEHLITAEAESKK